MDLSAVAASSRHASSWVGVAWFAAAGVLANGCLGDESYVPNKVDPPPPHASEQNSGQNPPAEPAACNPNGEPTWQEPVEHIMRERCVRCHTETRTYQAIEEWVENGLLEAYTENDHFIAGDEKTSVLRWLQIGTPETDCDVP